MNKKIIYLTFDDGIQEGTSCVLDVLAELDIKATFFLAGINSYHYYDANGHLFIDTLSRIIRHHEAGNHSFSHCNGLYKEYYSKGLLVGHTGNRISVTDDFTKNEVFFREISGKAALLYEPEKALFNIARLPGRNSWFYTLPDDDPAAGGGAADSKNETSC